MSTTNITFVEKKFDLEHELQIRGLTKADLHRMSGVSKPTLSLIEKKGIEASHPSTIRLIKEALETFDKGTLKEDISNYKVELELTREVPIIAMSTAGQAHDFYGIPIAHQITVPVHIPKHIKKAVGIKIVGDSMEPRYYAGQVVIVTDERKPINGDLVVANIKNMGPVFKKFHCNGDPHNTIITLSSFNEKYEPIRLKEEDLYWHYPVLQVVDTLGRI